MSRRADRRQTRIFSGTMSGQIVQYTFTGTLRMSAAITITSHVFDPIDLSPIGAYRADTCTLSGSNVTQLTDRSSNARNLTPRVSGNPVQTASDADFANQPSISSWSSNNCLVTSGNVTWGTQFAEIWMVGKGTVASSTQVIFSLGTSSQANVTDAFELDQIGANSQYQSQMTVASTKTQIWRSTNTQTGAESVAWTFDRTQTSANELGMFIQNSANGSLTVNSGTNSSGNFGTYQFCLGGRISGTSWGGKIAEIVLFDRLLTSTERAEMQQYFHDRYGI